MRRLVLAALGFGLLAAAGCTNPFNPQLAPTAGISQPPPEPSSPIGVLRLYEWCWNHRDPDLYRELFTDDYRFQFALTDTAGNAYRGNALTREEEINIATNIFVRGTAAEPPPVSIKLEFIGSLVAQDDSRPGKYRVVHKEIAAQTILNIRQPDIDVTGTTRFFVVRGDSALLPQELKDRGFTQDSTRWYIERIEDETLGEVAPARYTPFASAPRRGAALSAHAGAGAAAAADPLDVTWGWVRAFWDDEPRAAANRSKAADRSSGGRSGGRAAP